MNKREALKRISAARKVVASSISAHAASGGMYARGLASEGYNGGYLQALDDVHALLTHGTPSQRTRFWEEDHG